MSAGLIIAVFCVAMAFLILLMVKFKVNAALALLITVLLMGFALGLSFDETIKLVTTGFGNVMASIGIVIFLGVIIGVGLQETGAAVSINNFFNKLVGERHLPLSAGLTAFILSIPVFGDITVLLVTPIASALNYYKKISMKRLAFAVGVGCSMTHALVPPTPGILAASMLLGADLGKVILYGIMIGLPAYLVTYFVYLKVFKFLNIDEEVEAREDFRQALTEREKESRPIPSSGWALAPIFIPVILITLASVVKAANPDSSFIPVVSFFGDRVIAMLIGVAIVCFYALYHKDCIPKPASNQTYNEMVFGNWIERAMSMAAIPLVVTGMAGPFGAVIGATGIADKFAAVVQGAGIPLIIVPFVLSFLVGTIGGSATLAVMTSAGLAAPMLTQIGYSAEVVAMVCGLGSIFVCLMNQSIFWVTASFFNLNLKQTIQAWTIPLTMTVINCLVFLTIFVKLGIM